MAGSSEAPPGERFTSTASGSAPIVTAAMSRATRSEARRTARSASRRSTSGFGVHVTTTLVDAA